MNTLFNIEFQMDADHTMSDALKDALTRAVGCGRKDVESHEDYSLELRFDSCVKVENMINLVRSVMERFPGIAYADIIYRYPYEFVSDRVVIWQDGRTQSYTGRIIYVEDEENAG